MRCIGRLLSKILKLKTMYITEINASGYGDDGNIIIDGKYRINSYHNQDCCENVYADWARMQYFPSIPSGDGDVDVSTVKLVGDITKSSFVEPVEGVGFKIKCEQGYILVSCYDHQNGYYSSNLTLTCSGNNTVLWEMDISECSACNY